MITGDGGEFGTGFGMDGDGNGGRRYGADARRVFAGRLSRLIGLALRFRLFLTWSH